MIIRLIEEKDNSQIAFVIRECLSEYGCAGMMDTAWGDPYLDRFSEVYVHENDSYWVAENGEGTVVAGVGIAPLQMRKTFVSFKKCTVFPNIVEQGLHKYYLMKPSRLRLSIIGDVIWKRGIIWTEQRGFMKRTGSNILQRLWDVPAMEAVIITTSKICNFQDITAKNG